MMASLLSHICVTRPQWVNILSWLSISQTTFSNEFVLPPPKRKSVPVSNITGRRMNAFFHEIFSEIIVWSANTYPKLLKKLRTYIIFVLEISTGHVSVCCQITWCHGTKRYVYVGFIVADIWQACRKFWAFREPFMPSKHYLATATWNTLMIKM